MDGMSTSGAARAHAEKAARALGFFHNPQALSPGRHGTLRLAAESNNFAFARTTRLVPITIDEFERAALDYPIVFAGDLNRPCAVMGLKDGENLFIGADGALEAGKYAPALLRQHPFFLAHAPGVREPILMIDHGAERLSEEQGAALFEGGAISQTTRAVLKLCLTAQAQLAATERFTADLVSAKLIEPAILRMTPRDGERINVARFKSIKADPMAELPDETRRRFEARGYGRSIQAQAISQKNWPRFLQRALAKRAA